MLSRLLQQGEKQQGSWDSECQGLNVWMVWVVSFHVFHHHLWLQRNPGRRGSESSPEGFPLLWGSVVLAVVVGRSGTAQQAAPESLQLGLNPLHCGALAWPQPQQNIPGYGWGCPRARRELLHLHGTRRMDVERGSGFSLGKLSNGVLDPVPSAEIQAGWLS